jgi:hypothetical protein
MRLLKRNAAAEPDWIAPVVLSTHIADVNAAAAAIKDHSFR